MVFKDLKVNYSPSANERFNFLIEMIEKQQEPTKIYFVGETLYIMDLSIPVIERLRDVFINHPSHGFYIQDLDKLSVQFMNSSNQESWYKIINWPSNVTLFTRVEDVALTNIQIKEALVFSEIRLVKDSDTPDSIEEGEIYNSTTYNIDGILKEHENDLIGLFIDDIRKNQLEQDSENKIIYKGLEYLLRR